VIAEGLEYIKVPLSNPKHYLVLDSIEAMANRLDDWFGGEGQYSQFNVEKGL
jgi:hypothetical protein